MTTTEPTTLVAALTISLVLAAVIYVWTALALGAVFRKSGVAAWKAWVPFLNVYALLELGGLPGLLVLLSLVPVAGGLLVWVLTVIACHRVNVSFGFGAGMTVLAALLFPVWATVIGVGSARWIGAEEQPAPGPVRGRSTAIAPADEVPAEEPAEGLLTWAAPAPASVDGPVMRRTSSEQFGLDEGTGEVTGAVSGAPAPISAVPGGASAREEQAPPAPAVTRVPAMPAPERVEPWAPARSPEPDAFPEESGEVSAIAPAAEAPRSARGSVSAQHVRPEIPDDDLEQTVIATRRRARWSLALPGRTTVPLTADVVLVGRRPAPSTAFPGAQLVPIDDPTVSKTHLRLQRDGEFWHLVDLESTNGTVLFGSDGSETEITPGSSHPAPARFLVGDVEVGLGHDEHPR